MPNANVVTVRIELEGMDEAIDKAHKLGDELQRACELQEKLGAFDVCPATLCSTEAETDTTRFKVYFYSVLAFSIVNTFLAFTALVKMFT